MTEEKPEPPTITCVDMQEADLGAEGMQATPLIKGVNWLVKSSETWVIGGMHRSGKSTLLASLAMLQKPLSGRLELFGVDPWATGETSLMKQRLRVGLVFEAGARLLHQLTVSENVALPLCYHRDCPVEEAQERVNELLEFAGIADMERQLPGALSRTYLQRASLARALALSPELRLLDNPLAGVDHSERNWWLETVASLAQGHQITDGKPLTIVIVTNHLTPWLAAGRNFALLDGNCWRQIGSMTELQKSDDPVLPGLLARDK